jgi:hypothetical protein
MKSCSYNTHKIVGPFDAYRSSDYTEPPEIEYEIEPEFDYNQNEYLTEESVPNFAKAVFIDPYIKNSLKQEFLDEFLVPYLTDYSFRNKNKGKYIVFLNKKKYLIINNHDDLASVGDINDGKLCIHIGELPKIGNTFVSKVIINREEGDTLVKKADGGNLNIFKQNPYKITCGITHIPEVRTDHIAFDNNISCIVDTGADISYLFLFKYWKFDVSNFTNNIINGTTEYWSSRHYSTERIETSAANNIQCLVDLIVLHTPLYISINGLNPVPIMHLLVPIKRPICDTNFTYLIGQDILTQHTYIQSKFDGKVQLRIINQREENLLT